MASHTWLFWVAFAVSITIMLFLFGCNILVRKVPWNFIILIIFTVFESYLIASICIFQKPENILIAACLTFAMFCGLTILAFFVRCTLLDDIYLL
jgi:FtsH-binding integral membrane protein